MKLHIFYDLKDGPWGGGNQFLKALRNALIAQEAYSETLEGADAVLLNSHHFGEHDRGLEALYQVKLKRPDLPIIHRIDGPVRLIRGQGQMVDRMIFKANKFYANGTIFQTEWSRERSLALGYSPQDPMTTIINSVDPTVFYPNPERECGQKMRLIATSWAANKRKGFDLYHYLDEDLDFKRYEMVFVGNIMRPFKNIQHIPPQDSAALAALLREADIYITASQNDPCSNALCEGMACGLPALALNSGGHPEIIGDGGVVFEGEHDVLERLEHLRTHYDDFKAAIKRPTLSDIAQDYLSFAQLCRKNLQAHPKIISSAAPRVMKRTLRFSRLSERVYSALHRRLRRAS